jgi:hypothetical protein
MNRNFLWAGATVALIASSLEVPGALAADWYAPQDANPSASRTHIFSGADFNSFNGNFGFLGTTFAPWGLDNSGLRIGAFSGVGSYAYAANTGAKSGGKFVTSDAMIGWAVATETSNTKFMIGANFQDHKLDIPDPANPVQGFKAGFKGQVDTYINPTPSTMVFALGAYSTAFKTYFSEVKAGVALPTEKTVFIGPQFIALGNERFDQWRVGMHLTGVRFGYFDIDMAGGFVRDSGSGKGAYATIGGSIRF